MNRAIRQPVVAVLVVAALPHVVHSAPRLIACSASLADVYEVVNYATAPTMKVLVEHNILNFEDIAAAVLPDDRVFGVDIGTGTQRLYSINLPGGSVSPIGANLPPGGLLGLDMSCDGTLYASGVDGKIYTVEPTTGQPSELQSVTGWGAIADIAYASTDVGGVLYAATEGAASGGDQLVLIYLSQPWSPWPIGNSTLPEDTRGLDCDVAGNMWGVTGDATLFSVDRLSGIATTPVSIKMDDGLVRGANGLTFIDDCKSVSVERTHWGALKVRYR